MDNRNVYKLLLALILWLPFGCLEIDAQKENPILVGTIYNGEIVVPVGIYKDRKWTPFVKDSYERETPKRFQFYGHRVKKWYLNSTIDSHHSLMAATPVHFNPNDNYSGFGYVIQDCIGDKNKSQTTNCTVSSQKLSVYPFHSVVDTVDRKKFEIIVLNKHKEISPSTTYGYDWFIDIYQKAENPGMRLGRVMKCKIDSTTYYYIEAGLWLEEANCPAQLYYQAWIIDLNDKSHIVFERTGFDDCDGKLLSSYLITPYSVFKLDDECFILLEQHAWEHRDYDIIQVELNGIKSMLGRDQNYEL